jgi:DNA-binding transcriptional LysR family regulator
MNWNDFRLILAISRAGSLKGAAQSLGHDHSTVFRWLNALEAKFQVQLFERNAGAYLATDAGERMVLAAERMEEEALALDREITGRDARLSGNLNHLLRKPGLPASERLAGAIPGEARRHLDRTAGR